MQQISKSIFFIALAILSSDIESSPAISFSDEAQISECKDIKVPDTKNIQITHEGDLYYFKFSLPACGHSSYQSTYPTSHIVQQLVEDFYKSGTIKLTVTQDPPSKPLAKDVFLLEVRQSLFNNHFDFTEEVKLVYEINHIHMINQSHIIPDSITQASGLFKSLRDIQWKNDCEQESAGWCFTWNGYFSLAWKSTLWTDLCINSNRH